MSSRKACHLDRSPFSSDSISRIHCQLYGVVCGGTTGPQKRSGRINDTNKRACVNGDYCVGVLGPLDELCARVLQNQNGDRPAGKQRRSWRRRVRPLDRPENRASEHFPGLPPTCRRRERIRPAGPGRSRSRATVRSHWSKFGPTISSCMLFVAQLGALG
jgi:hypothetical protein